MAGIGFNISLDDAALNGVLHRLNTIGISRHDLLDTVGAVTESQTRERLSNEKSAPDGTPWQAWSPEYARTRHSGQSLLENEGHLVDSITHEVSGDLSITGSNLIYAAIQNEGGAEVGKPELVARPFLGISDDNRDELEAVLSDWISGLMSH